MPGGAGKRRWRLGHHGNHCRPGFGLLAHNDFYVAIQCKEELHETLRGKAVQFVVEKRRDLRLAKAQPPGNRGLVQLLLLDQLVERVGKPQLRLALPGIGQAEIGENVTASRLDQVQAGLMLFSPYSAS